MDDFFESTGFKRLTEPEGIHSEIHCPGPVQMEKNRKLWGFMDQDADRHFTAIGGKGALYEDTRNLVEGTANLVNTVLAAAESGDPIDTLVFLDKSARLGSYLFQVMWESMERQRSKQRLPSVVVAKPAIRFINVGLEMGAKHEDSSAQRQLSGVFNPEGMHGNVLVVDEFVCSGGSVSRARQEILKSTYAVKKVEAIGQFRDCPAWYDQDAVKGVTTAEELTLGQRMEVEELDPQLVNRLKTAIRILGSRAADQLIGEKWVSRSEISHISPSQQAKLQEQGINISQLKSDLKESIAETELGPSMVVEHFASAGGFLAMDPPRSDLAKSLIYRDTLRWIITESQNRGLLRYDFSITPGKQNWLTRLKSSVFRIAVQ